MRKLIVGALLITTLTGCAAKIMGPEWQAARANAEAARAAAEWAHTQQAEAQAAAVAHEAPAREQAITATLSALLAVTVLFLLAAGAAIAWRLFNRARLIYPDAYGLYPVAMGAIPTTTLNEPGAQHARIAPGRSPIQVLPPAEQPDPLAMIPEPVIIEGRRLQHIERLLAAPARSADHDIND